MSAAIDRAAIAAAVAKSQTGVAMHFQNRACSRVDVLVRDGWECRRVGPDGLGAWDHRPRALRLIHSIATELDGQTWAHVSVSRRDAKMPSWEQLRDVWRLIYPDVVAVVVIPTEDRHVNRAEVAHAWGCLTKDAVPDFTHGLGTI